MVAFKYAGIWGEHLDVAEVHDSTAYCELVATEALGLCARGEGGPLAESGATALGGATPVNPSGGLESKGHPLAATGLSMIHELCQQLRGEAGAGLADDRRPAERRWLDRIRRGAVRGGGPRAPQLSASLHCWHEPCGNHRAL